MYYSRVIIYGRVKNLETVNSNNNKKKTRSSHLYCSPPRVCEYSSNLYREGRRSRESVCFSVKKKKVYFPGGERLAEQHTISVVIACYRRSPVVSPEQNRECPRVFSTENIRTRRRIFIELDNSRERPARVNNGDVSEIIYLGLAVRVPVCRRGRIARVTGVHYQSIQSPVKCAGFCVLIVAKMESIDTSCITTTVWSAKRDRHAHLVTVFVKTGGSKYSGYLSDLVFETNTFHCSGHALRLLRLF